MEQMILQLGVAGVSLIIFMWCWTEFRKAKEAHIADLKENQAAIMKLIAKVAGVKQEES